MQYPNKYRCKHGRKQSPNHPWGKFKQMTHCVTVCVYVCAHVHEHIHKVMSCCRMTQCVRMYKNANSPNQMAHQGWSQCRSRFWVPPPARLPGSSPRACPRWRSWWTPPHSHFCPWLAGAPPERLHVTKLVPVTTAVFCFVLFFTLLCVQNHVC